MFGPAALYAQQVQVATTNAKQAKSQEQVIKDLVSNLVAPRSQHARIAFNEMKKQIQTDARHKRRLVDNIYTLTQQFSGLQKKTAAALKAKKFRDGEET